MRRGQDRAAFGERHAAVGGERARELQQRVAEALPEETAVGLGEQRLLDLPGALRAVAGERVEPDLEPVVDVGDAVAEQVGAGGEDQDADEDVGEAAGGDVEQRQERAEEHQRAAEVADEDDHQHRDAPDDEHRAEVLERRDREPEEAPRRDREQLALLGQVAGEEDDDAELRDLRRLEGQIGPMSTVR